VNATLPASPITITVPGAAPAAAYNGTLTVTVNNSTTGCVSDGSGITVTVNAAATANAGVDQTVNVGDLPVTLAGTIGGSATSATWSGGAGSFTPNNTTLTATYLPTAGEITSGSVTLTLTTDDPAGPCGAANDQMQITINAAAVAGTILSIEDLGGGSYKLKLQGSAGGAYHLVKASDITTTPMSSWTTVTGSGTNAPSPGGTWEYTVTGTTAPQFYRLSTGPE